MKQLITLLLALSLCFCMTACDDEEDVITFSADYNTLSYNGRTYVEYYNSNGKYNFNHDNEADGWQEICRLPYVRILAAYTSYYGDNLENPNIITTSRASMIYVREDITLDHNSTLVVSGTNQPFEFKIADVTYGEPLEEETVESALTVLEFDAAFKQYPYVSLRITISKYNGTLYLQDVWSSDYYPITDEFRTFLDSLFADLLTP